MKRLKREFFEQKTLKVARQLLGCFLYRKIGRRIIKAKIIETEAYVGPKDLASHASKGRTKRTEVMFGPAGRVYVYLIYGMYYCLNLVTEKENYPAAVLIRGVEINGQSLIGPGKVCRELKIDKTFNRLNIGDNQKLWLEMSNQSLVGKKINKLPRVNIDYAGEYKNKLWRFVLK